MTQNIAQRTNWKTILIGLMVTLFVGYNLFGMGGNYRTANLNNTVTMILAIGILYSALTLWRQLAVGARNYRMISGLTIGLILWSVAEIWWGVAGYLQMEVPYPSGADVLWLVGYIPIYMAFWLRIRGQTMPAQRWQMIIVYSLSAAAIILVSIFLLLPVIQSFDAAAPVESALNIIYPLVDLVILIFVLRLFFTYQQGMYGLAWGWLVVGLLLISVSDLVFVHATNLDLYYPEGEVNLISTLGVDVPYDVGYLCMLLGLSVLKVMQKSHHPFSVTIPELPLLPNTHMLISTQGNDCVIHVSNNYRHIFPLETPDGRTLAETLGLSPQDMGSLRLDLERKDVLEERQFEFETRSGPMPGKLSGEAILNGQREHSGWNFLVRIYLDDYSLDDELTTFQQEMVSYLRKRTGQSEQAEAKRVLLDYYQVYLRTFYNRIYSQGGSILAEAYLDELEKTASQCGWQVKLNTQSGFYEGSQPQENIRQALPQMLEKARQFVASMIDPAAADLVMETLAAQFQPATIRNIAYIENTTL